MKKPPFGIFLVLGCVFLVVAFVNRSVGTRSAFIALAAVFIALGVARARRGRGRG